MVSVMAQSTASTHVEQSGKVPRSLTATDSDAGPESTAGRGVVARKPALGTIEERASAHSRSQSSGAQFPSDTRPSDLNDAAPVVRYKVHEQVKKGEDFHLVDEVLSVWGTTSNLYCVFDGHGGGNAASFARNRIVRLLRNHLLQQQLTPKNSDKDGDSSDSSRPAAASISKARREGETGGNDEAGGGNNTGAENEGDSKLEQREDRAAPAASNSNGDGAPDMNSESKNVKGSADAGTVAGSAASETAAGDDASEPTAGNEGGAAAASWLKEQLPAALARAFLSCHNDFAKTGDKSGTTATVVIVSGWIVTVAAVGDSRAILDTGEVMHLTMDHRFEVNKDEQRRVVAEGGQLGWPESIDETDDPGPLRSWPGGLCVSRSIGDVDCGPYISPLPHVRQLVVPRSGGRIVIASDGLWDAVDDDRAAKCCRGMPAKAAAPQLVKESITSRGLRDDITVVVVDLLPSDTNHDDVAACPVPKTVRPSVWSKLKKVVSSKSSKQAAHTTPVIPEAVDCKPKVMKDEDSIKGGALYAQHLAMNLQSSGGIYCYECGQQIVATEESNVSIKLKKRVCARHMMDD